MDTKTIRLFDMDSHQYEFTAKVISSVPSTKKEGLFEVILDRTCFFPEGGGQYADIGVISDASVVDVQESNGIITHYAERNFCPGDEVKGVVDKSIRFNRMQNHSGEHIFSGIAHNKYGCENVGFHLTDTLITIDFDKFLDREQLLEIEAEANNIVAENRKIIAEYPSPEKLKTLRYRSKLELTENVRIVTIEGVDMCACCAPHVNTTGEIGCIKVLDSLHYKGGVRLYMVCGAAALKEFESLYEQSYGVSQLLTAPKSALVDAVKKHLDSKEELKAEITSLHIMISEEIAEKEKASIINGDEKAVILLPFRDAQAMRNIANTLTPLSTGAIAVLSKVQDDSYQYIIGRSVGGLKALSRELNAKLNGKGGGSDIMIQGTFNADIAMIETVIRETM